MAHAYVGNVIIDFEVFLVVEEKKLILKYLKLALITSENIT